ncbi:hypothetical protein [Candidatus Electrothrix sp.]|uniref:hypothetical protein n=1 Tax=Candidatus Electrothrix sp. TaxID=2170559 RepID=UPI004055BCAC
MLSKCFSSFSVCFFLILVWGTPCSFGKQPPDNLIPQDIDNAYILIKRTFQVMIDTGNINPTFFREEDGRVDLLDCHHGSSFLSTHLYSKPNFLAEELADVAFRIVVLEWNLNQLDYPSELWRPALNMLEKHQKKMVSKAYASSHFPLTYLFDDSATFLKKLALLLNIYRITQAEHLSPVWVEGGCGAGEIGINISTVPQNGRVWLIPTFFYELCRVKKIDPFDPAKCTRWREHVKGLLFDVAGDYKYYAVWPDGFVKKGTLAFTNVEYGQTVVISQDQGQSREKKAHGGYRTR